MESNLEKTAKKPWQQWKTPSDALAKLAVGIAWAQSELPAHNPDWVQKQWEQLQPDENGKKAHLWVNFVEDLKTNEFADLPKLIG